MARRAGGSVEPRPVRVTRTTRSMSREPEQPPPSQLGRKQLDPSKPRSRNKKNDAVLPPLDEEEAAATALLPSPSGEVIDDGDDQEQLVDAADDLLRRQYERGNSVASAYSRTTVKTMYSQEQIADLDPSIMVDRLKRLAGGADDLVEFLLPKDETTREALWKDIVSSGSANNRIFRGRASALKADKEYYGEEEYVEPSFVLRALLGLQAIEDVPLGSWRPDNIIYKVNLAQMLRRLLITYAAPQMGDDEFESQSEVDSRHSILYQLDIHFPSAIAGPTFDTDACRVALAITVQHTIARIAAKVEEDPRVSPIELIDDTFYERSSYKHSGALGLTVQDLETQQTWNSEIGRSISTLKKCFNKPGDSTDTGLEKAKLVFKWTRFRKHLVAYLEARYSFLNQQIVAAGDLSRIAVALAAEVQKWQRSREADRKRLAISASAGTPRKSFPTGSFASLRAREKRISGIMPAATAPSRVTTIDPAITRAPDGPIEPLPEYANLRSPLFVEEEGNNIPEPIEVDDSVEGLHTTQSNSRRPDTRQLSPKQSEDFLAKFHSQTMQAKASQRQPKSFFDAQPDATRVSFNEDEYEEDAATQGGNTNDRPSSSLPMRNSKKRALDVDEEGGQEDFEPTQDQGFQTDARDQAAAANYRRKQIRSVQSSYAPSATLGRPSTTQAGPLTARTSSHGQPGVLSMTQPDPTPSAHFEMARQVAREQAVNYPGRGTQQRRTWTLEEEEALAQLIHGSEKGISWARLKTKEQETTNVLRLRSAEDMRFKARNMKVTLLLAGNGYGPREGAENWDFVALGKKEIDKLKSRGVDYDQPRMRGGE